MRLKVITGKNDTVTGGGERESLRIKQTMKARCDLGRLFCGRSRAATGSRSLRSHLPRLVVVLALATAGLASLQAQTNVSPGRRYLLIVETSKAMSRRLTGLNQVIRQLGSNLHRELQPGDTLGVWTFNDALFTGRFPLQHFSPETQPAVIGEVLSFLKSQKYENAAQWAPVLPALKHVVQVSPVLTIILVTAGTESIQGTPFDARINQAWSSWRGPQESARLPLVTVLRTDRGQITHWAVSAPPWPLELPPAPAMPQLPKPVATTTSSPPRAVPAPQPPPIIGKPLIVSGRKPQPIAPLTTPPPAATDSFSPPENPAATANLQSAAASGVDSTRPPPAAPEATAQSHPEPAPTEPATPAARLAAPEPTTPESDSRSIVTNDPVSGEPAAPAQLAAAHAPAGHRLLLPVAAAGGLCVAAIALVLLRKRSRTTGHISLITRSYERQQHENDSAGSVRDPKDL
jgi:hypothetical protein